MNKPKNIVLIAAAAILSGAASLPANAVDFYVGGAVGASNFGNTGTAQEGVSAKRRDVGYKVLLGARFMPELAIEGGYTDLGKAKFNLAVPGGAVVGNLNGSGIFVDAVGTLPINSDWSAFAKVGMLSGKIKVSVGMAGQSDSLSDTVTGARFGFGATYSVTKAVSIRTEWERSRGDATLGGQSVKGNVDLLSVGLNYSF